MEKETKERILCSIIVGLFIFGFSLAFGTGLIWSIGLGLFGMLIFQI